MHITGIIAEYNPFHNGHLYHLEKAKELTSCDGTVAVMSGNFLQRGIPAVIDKFTRGKMACMMGIDAVFELPALYACSSAEFFASGAVLTLERLGVDSLCFGAECDDITLLKDIAALLLEEPAPYKETLKEALKEGFSFPKARAKAASVYLQDASCQSVLETPNNILAIEYLKAISRFHCRIKPYAIKRKGAMYHDTALYGNISSATAIRNCILEKNTLDSVKHDLPEPVYALLQTAFLKTFPIFDEDFASYLSYALLYHQLPLAEYMDWNEALMKRCENATCLGTSVAAITDYLKTRQYTSTRINRCLFHLLLQYTNADLDLYTNHNYVYYGRLLAMRKDHSHVIKELNTRTSIPVITKVSHGKQLLNPIGLSLLEKDIQASSLYQMAVSQKYNITFDNDYLHSPERI